MSGVDPTVRKETGYIALVVVILSMLMEAVYFLLGRWDIKVLYGNLLGGCMAILNFFLMGLTLQKAVTKEPKDASTLIKLSQNYRTIMLFIIVGLGLFLPFFNTVSAILPLFFPRVGIGIRSLIDKKAVKNDE